MVAMRVYAPPRSAEIWKKFGKSPLVTWATLQGHAEASGPEAARLWQSLIVDEFNLAQKQNYQPIDDLRGRGNSDIIDIPVPSRPTATCVGYGI